MKTRIYSTDAFAFDYGQDWAENEEYKFDEYGTPRDVAKLLRAFPEDGELSETLSPQSTCDCWVGKITIDCHRWTIAGNSTATSQNGTIWMCRI